MLCRLFRIFKVVTQKSRLDCGIRRKVSSYPGSWVSMMLLLFYVSPVWAGGLTAQDILQNMRQQEMTLEDLQFNLRQTMYLKTLKERQRISAWVMFKKPDLILVEYKTPLEQLVIANEKEIAMYLKEKGIWQETSRQKIDQVLGKNWKADYGLWLSEEIEKNYTVSVIKASGDQVGLMLKPKEKSYDFTMTIYLDSRNWLPVKTVWEDANQVITTEITNAKINSKIAAEVFKFK